MDEPTSALDPKSEVEIMEEFFDIPVIRLSYLLLIALGQRGWPMKLL
ncbi:hypothetical protein AAHB94_02180 [Bacillus toyonensis]